MLRKPAVMIVSILSFILFSALFFTACEDTLLTEPAISESAPESLIPEPPVPGDLGAFSLAKGKPASAGGFDEFGYNYQANMFNGLYGNASRPDPPVIEDDTWLQMKWSDEWLNEDRERCVGTPQEGSSACEGSWLTNHQRGTNTDGSHWNYFVKIVFPGDSAYTTDGYWYTADSVKIGSVLWGAYARIQQVYNDPNEEAHGIQYKSPASPGFGFYKP